MGALTVMLAGWGMVLAARGLGEWVLKPFKVADSHRLSQALWATALGLGVIALGTLGLGMAGFPRAGLGICVLGLLLGLGPFGHDLAAARRAARGFRWASWDGVLVLACMLVLAGTVFFALLPQCDYDVLEYHLGAPMHYLRLGEVEHLPWNVYASFPENTEMLYLCLLALFGSAMKGGMAAAALNVAVGVLCALAVADLARALFGPRAAGWAAALFYAYPLTWNLSGVCYVEVEQVLFSVLCVRALVGEGGRRAALAGVLAGLAMGTKYPAAVFLALPVGLFVLGRRGFLAGAAFMLAAAVVVSPWLVKNASATRNPVYPLLGDVFRTERWSDEQEARFTQAHHPPRPTTEQAVRDFRTAVSGHHETPEGDSVWLPPRVSLLLLLAPLLLVLPLEQVRRRSAIPLLLLFVAHLAAWWHLTHRIDRFFYPAVPWLAVLGGAGLSSLSNEFLRNAIRFTAAVVLWFQAGIGVPYLVAQERIGDETTAERVLRGRDPWDFLHELNAEAFEPMDYVNAELPKDSRVLVLGEARTFYLEREFIAATVFDPCPWEDIFPIAPKDGAQARELLRKEGITHILVNWTEVHRLKWSYAYDWKGRRLPGYSDTVSPEVFRVLERDVLERVRTFGPVHPEWGCELVVLYRVRPG
ncbi:MAG: hypothetical protein AAB434_07380 [Planctomycetota bacterium]